MARVSLSLSRRSRDLCAALLVASTTIDVDETLATRPAEKARQVVPEVVARAGAALGLDSGEQPRNRRSVDLLDWRIVERRGVHAEIAPGLADRVRAPALTLMREIGLDQDAEGVLRLDLRTRPLDRGIVAMREFGQNLHRRHARLIERSAPRRRRGRRPCATCAACHDTRRMRELPVARKRDITVLEIVVGNDLLREPWRNAVGADNRSSQFHQSGRPFERLQVHPPDANQMHLVRPDASRCN